MKQKILILEIKITMKWKIVHKGNNQRKKEKKENKKEMKEL